ncbi:hypothetical protein [Rhizobium sp. RU20A]|uniref:hypothetical protein n=1 Tax=Rhizobium sp. RU20A TaxID=1907412 RepID=UPI00122D0CC9|nr:hypothetical protein [Rhizobium sp. RU20A]
MTGALLVAAASPAVAGEGDETFLFGAPLAPGKLAAACFERRYDDAHLKAHPRQNVTAVTVLATRDEWQDAPVIVDLSLSFRKVSEPVRLSGGCTAVDGKVDRLACAIECDGGSFTLERDANGRLFFVPGHDLHVCGEEGEAAPGARLGADDDRFRLEPVPAKGCAGITPGDDMRFKLTRSPPAP